MYNMYNYNLYCLIIYIKVMLLYIVCEELNYPHYQFTPYLFSLMIVIELPLLQLLLPLLQ